MADHNATLKPWNSWRSLARLMIGVPTLAAAAGLLSGIDGNTLEPLAIAGLAVAVYAAGFGSVAFHYKRSVFLGAPGDRAVGEKDFNTYRAEDQWWDQLGLKKKLERTAPSKGAALSRRRRFA